MDLREQTFGIEIETVGASRETVAGAVHTVVGGTLRGTEVIDRQGRTWKVVRDGSLANGGAEVVSPILRYPDLEELQAVVRAIRACGAKADASCGIHVHVGAQPHTARSLANLAKQVNKNEALLVAALQVLPNRQGRYARLVDQTFLGRIVARAPRTLDELNTAWYGFHNPSPTHYDQTRYHGLNLHNVWYRGTVEFRWFNGTLHAGKVKAYVQLCLAISAKALNSRSASHAPKPVAGSAKYDLRVWLLNLGLIGDEFKTARLHLTQHLAGSAAWKHGRPQAAAA
jgi:hypothetical protein